VLLFCNHRYRGGKWLTFSGFISTSGTGLRARCCGGGAVGGHFVHSEAASRVHYVHDDARDVDSKRRI